MKIIKYRADVRTLFIACSILVLAFTAGHGQTLQSKRKTPSSSTKAATPNSKPTPVNTSTAPAQAVSLPKVPDKSPWEKWGLTAGGIYAKVESNIRVGSDVSLNLNGEDALELDRRVWAVRAEASYRFTKNRRHRLDASWFNLRRDGERTTRRDIDITDVNGNVVTLPAGTHVSIESDLQIMELAYSYSFLQDARVDLAGVGGLYMMPVDFQLTASDVGSTRSELNFTAPLPAVGMRMDAVLTPKWFFRSGSQIFDLEYEQSSGYLIQLRAAIEYFPIYSVGLGVGVESMRVNIEAAKKDSESGERGEADIQYTGLQLYAKCRF